MTKAVRRQIDDLRETIRQHDRLYYVEAAPEISDRDYDRLLEQLRRLEQAHPDYDASDVFFQVATFRNYRGTALRQAERVPTPGGVLLDPHGSTATGRTPFTTPPSTPWTSWSARFTMPRTWWSATGARSRASIASWSSWHTSRGGDRPCPPGPAPARPCTAGPHPL